MDTRLEKLLLLAIAAACVIALTWIALTAIRVGTIDANGATLVGVIVGGLIAGWKDIIAAVRSYSMSAQLGKVTDQLAASGPVTPDTSPSPQNAIDAADKVAGAATDAAADIAQAQPEEPS